MTQLTIEPSSLSWIAFANTTRIATGDPRQVTARAIEYHAAHPAEGLLVFDARTSQTIELDLRGNPKQLDFLLTEVVQPVSPSEEQSRKPGRPRLGVVAREVTLLPRHWEWLATQPGGASVALRKLVEQARRTNQEADLKRQRQDAAYKFMNVMAGDAPGYEEALRALFAGDLGRLRSSVAAWPVDVREHALSLAAPACGESAQATVP